MRLFYESMSIEQQRSASMTPASMTPQQQGSEGEGENMGVGPDRVFVAVPGCDVGPLSSCPIDQFRQIVCANLKVACVTIIDLSTICRLNENIEINGATHGDNGVTSDSLRPSSVKLNTATWLAAAAVFGVLMVAALVFKWRRGSRVSTSNSNSEGSPRTAGSDRSSSNMYGSLTLICNADSRSGNCSECSSVHKSSTTAEIDDNNNNSAYRAL